MKLLKIQQNNQKQDNLIPVPKTKAAIQQKYTKPDNLRPLNFAYVVIAQKTR